MFLSLIPLTDKITQWRFPRRDASLRCPEYTHKTEVQASHGMNKHSGFGGLCAESCGAEFQFMVKRHLVGGFGQRQKVWLSTHQQAMKGFDCADSEIDLKAGVEGAPLIP